MLVVVGDDAVVDFIFVVVSCADVDGIVEEELVMVDCRVDDDCDVEVDLLVVEGLKVLVIGIVVGLVVENLVVLLVGVVCWNVVLAKHVNSQK